MVMVVSRKGVMVLSDSFYIYISSGWRDDICKTIITAPVSLP